MNNILDIKEGEWFINPGFDYPFILLSDIPMGLDDVKYGPKSGRKFLSINAGTHSKFYVTIHFKCTKYTPSHVEEILMLPFTV